MGYRLTPNRDLSPMAWWLIPIGIVIAALILLFGIPQESDKAVVVTEEGAGYQRVRLAHVGEAPGQLDDQFRLLATDRHQQLLRRLEQFRADYRAAAPQLRVWAQPGLESRTRLAQQLGRDLSRHQLGNTVQKVEAPAVGVTAPLLLVCAEEDRRIAQQLLAALSVYLTGEVELHFDEAVSLNEMTLYLLGEPSFGRQGVVVFTRPP